ncbi:L,D-transpeptidase [Sporanaerobium hydrogeniformans]|uniref:L,D-transpeptidase n=1 Tax=Sporanaerobium hydrogeniformans TaxID=3072179 RepID=UPI0015D4A180|nr:L,D-transpeptidase [Sporanaerobium hydrogeniformans]
MMHQIKNKNVLFSFFIILLLICIWFSRDFHLSWVEVYPNEAKVTINFLFPMVQEQLEDALEIIYESPYISKFEYQVKWLSSSVAELHIKEESVLKGQKVQLVVRELPSTIPFVTKSMTLPIQFQTPVQVVEPMGEKLIATESPFYVRFNTPMNKNKIHHYLECDGSFYIKPARFSNQEGKESEDLSCYIFTPKEPLENGRRYILSFRKGLPAQSGALLQEDYSILLQTDTKPIISGTYPTSESKWIGLYPRFTLETQTPVIGGTLKINGENIKAQLKTPYELFFLAEKVLAPQTTYTAEFQVEAVTGEKSEKKTITFTTVDLEENRIWLEVEVSKTPQVKVYQGSKLIKTMPCSLGLDEKETPLGTYYIQSKEDVYTNSKTQEGANFWLPFTEQFGFQGLIRDNYWQVKNHAPNQLGFTKTTGNIVLSDEDARWLYEKVMIHTMVILHH